MAEKCRCRTAEMRRQMREAVLAKKALAIGKQPRHAKAVTSCGNTAPKTTKPRPGRSLSSDHDLKMVRLYLNWVCFVVSRRFNG